jgi:hypothetical protein
MDGTITASAANALTILMDDPPPNAARPAARSFAERTIHDETGDESRSP